MHNYLDFEKPIAELEGKIEELRHQPGSEGVGAGQSVGPPLHSPGTTRPQLITAPPPQQAPPTDFGQISQNIKRPPKKFGISDFM